MFSSFQVRTLPEAIAGILKRSPGDYCLCIPLARSPNSGEDLTEFPSQPLDEWSLEKGVRFARSLEGIHACSIKQSQNNTEQTHTRKSFENLRETNQPYMLYN